MAKSIPILLPNGRSWSKKGDARDHFKAMLARYRDGDRVSNATDHADLDALLAVYDSFVPPVQTTKKGSGVAHFERRMDKDSSHQVQTSCFFVVQTDGSSIDFSTLRARRRRRSSLLKQQISFDCLEKLIAKNDKSTSYCSIYGMACEALIGFSRPVIHACQHLAR